MDGKALVRVAQLRGRIAALARGGRFDVAAPLLDELVRADLALGFAADGLLRARQAASLASTRGEPLDGPLVVLAATLLAAGDLAGAVAAAGAALEAAGVGAVADPAADLGLGLGGVSVRAVRVGILSRLVAGAAHRRLGQHALARPPLDAARAAAARVGAAELAGFALAELGRVDLGEGAPAPAAVSFDFAAEMFRRGARPALALEAAALAVTSWAAAGDLDAATERAARVADDARAAGRLDLVALVDASLSDAMLAVTPSHPAVAQACALAAESAQAMPDSPLARDLRAQARLRQARVAVDAGDRARHLEAAIEQTRALDRRRAGLLLGGHLVVALDPADARRVASALLDVGDDDLAALARDVLAIQ